MDLFQYLKNVPFQPLLLNIHTSDLTVLTEAMWWNVFYPSSKVSEYFAEGRVEGEWLKYWVMAHVVSQSRPRGERGFKAGEVCFYSSWLYIHSRGLFVHTLQTW